MKPIAFQTINWNEVEKTEHKGATGSSFWQTVNHEGLRVRIVEYGPGYLADHWCQKGHIVHCLSGSFKTELETGENCILTEGMSYIVSDEQSSHRSSTKDGVKLLIVDGSFLNLI